MKWIFFDSVNSLYYKLPKINRNRSGSYIDSPGWLKIKKQQKITLNYQFAGNTFFLSKRKKKPAKSLNQIINQLILISYMCPTILKSKYNLNCENCENKVILLIITDSRNGIILL